MCKNVIINGVKHVDAKRCLWFCKECNQKNTGINWCKACDAKHFQQIFEKWTSGNVDIDKFIQEAQLSSNYNHKVLEWIPYDRFYDIEYIAKGGFGTVYRANWIDGYILNWNNTNQNWDRLDHGMFVALKSLDNSKNVTLEFINEVRAWTRTRVTRVDSSRTRTRVRNFLTRVRTGITWLIVLAEPVCNSCRHYAYSGLGKITNSFLARTSTLTRINSSPDSSPGLEYSSSQKNSWLVLLELTRPDSSPSSSSYNAVTETENLNVKFYILLKKNH